MTDLTTVADVATERPARYGKQLAAHLGRRMGSDWSDDDRAGWIQFGAGRAVLTCTESTLRIELTTEPGSVGTLEDVIGRHLVRFGARDELVVAWRRDDGSTGTRQENTGEDEGRPGREGAGPAPTGLPETV
ncbi:DUF2218 domain-containing protein [Propioniciclava soli]|uniref:DUF2218 domain-containing protein n=1 Tax=Propioniciclava soli TaxID=2775081 RepID=UPI001E3957CA